MNARWLLVLVELLSLLGALEAFHSLPCVGSRRLVPIAAATQLARARGRRYAISDKPKVSKPIIRREFARWQNPSFTPEAVTKMWNGCDALMTVGIDGAGQTHANQLGMLLRHHGVAKIKLSTDKLDPPAVAEQLLQLGQLEDTADIVEMRRKFILFASSSSSSSTGSGS